MLARLRPVVPFDAAFVATADPETMLFTGAWAEDPMAPSGPLSPDNEFGAAPDVNRFADLARARRPAATLDQATAGGRAASRRWRKIMAPLGLGDELRVALRSGSACWGLPAAVRLTAGSGRVLSIHATRLRDAEGAGPTAISHRPGQHPYSGDAAAGRFRPHRLPASRRPARLQGRSTREITSSPSATTAAAATVSVFGCQPPRSPK